MFDQAHKSAYTMTKIKEDIKSTLSKLSVLLVAIIVEAYLLVNGGLLFGQPWQPLLGELKMYILIDALFLFLAIRIPNPFSEITIWKAMIYFVPSLLAFWLIFQAWNIYNGVTYSPLSANSFIMNVLFQMFVVSFSEEMIFRGILLKYIGIIPQGILFGLFHLAAYNGLSGHDASSLILACALGIIYGVIVKCFQSKNKAGIGISITWGLHAGYNLAILVGLLNVV